MFCRHRLLIILSFLLLLAAPAAARWYSVQTPSFTLYAQRSADDARAQAAQLEAFDALLRKLWHVDAPPPHTRLAIYLIDSDAAFDALSPGSRYDGFFTASPATIAAFVRRSSRLRPAQALHTMFHEYAHHFMFAYLPGAYPAWYSEGVASYLETARFELRSTVYGDYDYGRMKSLVLQRWLPMRRVFASDWSTVPQQDLQLFYAQSWLAVHYLARDPDRAVRLANYLADVARGTAADTAFARTFGYPIEQFDGKLIAYAGAPELTQTRLDWVPPALPLIATERPAADDALLLPAAMLAIGVADDARGALLDRVQKAAARWPDDAYAQSVAAEAELRLGDPARAQVLIARLRAAAPEDANLLYLQALALVMTHQPAGAALAQADAAQPDDYRILFLRALAAPSLAAAQAWVLRAHDLAPQVAPITIAAAQVRWQRGDIAGARILLQQVARDPHGSPLAARAALLLAELPPI